MKPQISNPTARAASLAPRAACVAPILAWLLLTLTGCGPGDGRQALSGEVFLDGELLSFGSISFRPVGHTANTAGATLHNGKFSIAAQNGLVPGTYAVTVQAFRLTGRSLDDPQRGGKVPEYEQLRLERTDPAEVTIGSSQPNQFEIKLATMK